VDEQQRFGVAQRGGLRAKGTNPHLLVMTATPIPRSLALTVYGDLDVSILDELPPGRQTVETRVLYPDERERAHSFVRSQVDKGRQAFMIYPLVEENSGSHVRGAVDEYSRLQEDVFPDLRLGLLHGRIKPAEKDLVMEAFRSGELDILVATSVIEVGVDVPNASVMFIESANRFGLAQLHQFRGRVGRGEHKSFCLLVSDMREVREDLFEKKSNKRLRLMETVSDGFSLAEKDMELRGPGEFLGTRQAGHVPLQMASLTDIRLVNSARREADRLFSRDPDFADPEHHLLGDMVDNSRSAGTGDVS
jgi:ATP-dependent DNA helicase RecG